MTLTQCNSNKRRIPEFHWTSFEKRNNLDEFINSPTKAEERSKDPNFVFVPMPGILKFSQEIVCQKQSKGEYMRDHLTFGWRMYFSRQIRFSRTLVCGLFKNTWFSSQAVFQRPLPIFLAASPLPAASPPKRYFALAYTIPLPWSQRLSFNLFLCEPLPLFFYWHKGRICINELPSFRPKSVSPQLRVVSPQLKVVSPQLKVVSPRPKHNKTEILSCLTGDIVIEYYAHLLHYLLSVDS